jgi:hypothetical protein
VHISVFFVKKKFIRDDAAVGGAENSKLGFMWSILSTCGGGKQGMGVINDHIPRPRK